MQPSEEARVETTQPAVAPKAGESKPRGGRKANRGISGLLQSILIPLLAVLTGLIIGAIVIVITDPVVVAAFGDFFQAPGAALAAAWKAVATAYGALFYGSFGSPGEIMSALKSGDPAAIRQAFWPFTEGLVASTPYIFTGLAVGLGFKAGLFNIGAEGQFFMGSLGAVFVGYSLAGWPWYLHLPLAILGGFAAGAIWGAIPGWLKARFGAHEVVNTIMMNYVAYRLSDWLINGPMKAPGFRPVTPYILETAALPRLFADPLRINIGFLLALITAGVVFWLLFKTTIGFTIRVVGANPNAARYAGMNIGRTIILAMTLSGGLAGLGGASQVLGVDYWVGQGFSAGYGFDAIAVALIGKSHPFGIVLAALLWGFLRSGATRMQSLAGIPIDIISIIQALVIVFVAAPDIIRWLWHLPKISGEKVTLNRMWGS
jgi:ABC-type uncharacterized transport system permease subunit